MSRHEAVAKVFVAAATTDALDCTAVCVTGAFPVELDDMGIRGLGLIAGHVEAGDQCPRQHLSALVDVEHFAHDQEAAPDLHEVTLVSEPFQVGTTTERSW